MKLSGAPYTVTLPLCVMFLVWISKEAPAANIALLHASLSKMTFAYLLNVFMLQDSFLPQKQKNW